MKTAANMLPNTMSDRPGYTSGRGATLTDLNSEKLDHIFKEIKENIGKDASEEFIAMVVDLKVASCTGFLVQLYRLESNGWMYIKQDEPEGKRNDTYVENQGEAIGMMMSGMFSNDTDRDETIQIVLPFLSNHNKSHCTMSGKQWVNKEGCYYDYR